MNDEKPEYIRNWLKKADNDLANARIVLESEPVSGEAPYDTVCFHCQQAAEKYVKACLVHFDLDVPRTHDLADLLSPLLPLDEAFRTINKPAEFLTPFAADIRYPDDYRLPDAAEARAAFEIAMRIKGVLLESILKEYREE